MLRASPSDRRTTVLVALVFFSVVAVTVGPLLMSGVSDGAGLKAYAEGWTTNSALFPIIEGMCRVVAGAFGSGPGSAGLLARAVIAVLLAGLSLASGVRPLNDAREFLARAGLLTVAVLLLSPAQYPWYYVWAAPFLALFQWRGLLIAAVTLPITYSYFHFIEIERTGIYHNAVVWLIWAPVWAGLVWDWRAVYPPARANTT